MQLLLLDWLWSALWSVEASLEAFESAELVASWDALLDPPPTTPAPYATGALALIAV
jgi:hypothetical protein